ncbi:hypothetical protein C0585_02705 [Candidatus Woesearchaeota archaeon]|nr:MAG: hypothetical protein C0585_02705 [Candidatus Woesearchaeota archaeon]
MRKLEKRLLVLTLILVILSFSALALQLTTDKKSYYLNEPVKIIISQYSQDANLIISSKLENYKFLGVPDPLMTFIPKNLGNYTVTAISGGVEKSLIFTVYPKTYTQSNQDMQGEPDGSPSYLPYFEIDKDIYAINDRVTIKIYSEDYDFLEINDGKNNYRFLGKKEEIFFIPRKEGNYTITLYKKGIILTEKIFKVSNDFLDEIYTNSNLLQNKYIIQEPTRQIKKMYLDPKILDSNGKKQDLEIIDGSLTYSSLGTDILIDDWKDSLKLIPKNMKLKSLEFKNLDLRNGFDLGLEELNTQKIVIPYKKIDYSYAIDPEKLNFTYARITVAATGNELYKCALWNFTTQTCLGQWVKIKDISPGQNYTILLTPKDPAYAETTKNSDSCFDEDNNVECTSTQITAISANGGGTYTPFSKTGGSPIRIGFANVTDTQMDQIVECTVHVEGADSEGANTWTLQLGNYSANTWDTGTGQTISSTELDHTWDCISYFNGFTNDYSAFNTFGVRISTNDAGKASVGYIDWVWIRINYTLLDLIAPYYSNLLANPTSPATYNPTGIYQFNTTWQDNEKVDDVIIEHNFTGILTPYPVTGNLSSVYYYNYGSLAAGTYIWRTIANDTSNNTNQTLYQNYIVNKAYPSLNLELNGISSNITIERKSFAWINASTVIPSSGYIESYIDTNLINNGNSPLSNYTQFNNFGIFEARVEYPATQNYSVGTLSYYLNVTDTTPPSTVTSLLEVSNGTTWFLINWTNPTDDDFNHTKIYVNGIFYSDAYHPLESINITDRIAGTIYLISTLTSDHYGNINTTWVNITATTQTSADTTPPIIFNIQNTSITDSGVNISFETDEIAKHAVLYGLISGIYTDVVSDDLFDFDHWFLIENLIPSTTYYYVANATYVAGNTNNSIEYSFTTQLDSTPPYWSNPLAEPSSPTTYLLSGSYQINTTWIDNGIIDSVWIEHNISGIFENYSMTGNVLSVYYYDFIGSLAAGTYSWRTWANDSEGNINSTPFQIYIVNKASSNVNLLLNGTDGDFSIDERQYANITGILNVGQGNITLWIESQLIANGSTPLTNMTQFNIPGTYDIWVKYFGNQNYTGSNETHTLTVNDTYPPRVNLTNPYSGYTDIDGDMIFYFNVTDTGITDECSIYINGSLEKTKQIITEGINTFTVTEIPNGDYVWNVTCNDTIGNEGHSETWNFTIFINEFYPQIYPETCIDTDGICAVTNINLSDALYEEHTSNWQKQNRYDYFYINFTNPDIPAGSTIHWLNITYNKYQDTTDGNIFLEWYDNTTDNWIEICAEAFTTASTPPTYDGINCEFNQSGNGWPTIDDFNNGLQVRSVWYYSGGVAASVAHGTEFTSIYLKYTEDVTPPTIELVNPPDEDPRNVGDVLFQYIPSDPILYNCSIWGDFNGTWMQNYTDTSPVTDIVNNITVYLEEGYYTWNVKCYDERGNNAFALANWSINITNPDLEITSNNIVFSNDAPKENEEITINATIRNRGNVNATASFDVEFYLGDPDISATQIGTAKTIDYLGYGENTTLSVKWNVTGPGPHDIYVIVDIPLITNGSISETNEGNNKAFNTLNVPSWTYTYGDVSADIQLATDINFTLNKWWKYSPYGNVYVVETGSAINWKNLQALGIKVDNTTSSNDFEELDAELLMTGFNDSVNNTYTLGGLPISTSTFLIYYSLLDNVPVVDSTNNSDFITGILWDSGDGGLEYDGSQDIIFVTKINQDITGKFGNYDYEVKYPSLLKDYHEATYNTVTFYTEIS